MRHYRIKHNENGFEVYERGFLTYHFMAAFATVEKAYKYINDINHGVSVIIREVE